MILHKIVTHIRTAYNNCTPEQRKRFVEHTKRQLQLIDDKKYEFKSRANANNPMTYWHEEYRAFIKQLNSK